MQPLFTVTNVTSRKVIWACHAASAAEATDAAAAGLRRKASASWHVCLASELPDGGAESLAFRKGIEDGIENVETLLREDGKAAVLSTLKPGQEDWDFAARNADAASHARIAPGLQEAYYSAYGASARARAEAIEDGEE